MKFGETFESHLTTEWGQQYLHYTELKKLIRNAVEKAPTTNVKRVEDEYYERFGIEFFETLKEELKRVNDFFEYKLAEARRKHATFKAKFMYPAKTPGGDDMGVGMPKLPPLDDQPKNLQKLGRAYSEFYFSLVLLNNFQQLNLVGFHKLCRKFDKYLKTTMGNHWLKEHIQPATINHQMELQGMITEVENLYTEYLTKGDRTKAMAKLRVPPLGQSASPTQIFIASLLLGLFIVSAIMCLASYTSLFDQPALHAAFNRLYRGPLILIIYGFYMAINVYVWQTVGINHVLIFELNPRNQIEPVVILGIASLYGYICTLSMLLFIHHNEFGLNDPFCCPLICMLLPLALLLNPLPIMNRSARMRIFRIFGHIIAAPFFNVSFADFWLADQLNSLVLCLVDHYHLLRFYVRYIKDSVTSFDFEPDGAVSVIRCLPAWFRLAQCLRRYWDSSSKPASNLANAVTYGSTLIVVIISTIQMETGDKYESTFENPWTWAYIISTLISTIYCTAWDLLRDYGLFQTWRGGNIFLREHLIYPKWFYYFGIVVDLLIRFAWVLELYLIYNEYLAPYHCKTITSLCELTRRFIWNFLRLENEHLYNCGHYRATRDIYISALNSRQDLLVASIIDESTQTTATGAEEDDH